VRSADFQTITKSRQAVLARDLRWTKLTQPCTQVTPDVITAEEEAALVQDVDRWFTRKRYDGGHFDKVIMQYREVQKPARRFSEPNRHVLQRLRNLAFPSDADLLPVHVLDLAADGEIGLHVDHVEYSGRFMLLPRRSLYVMADEARYDWAHSIPMQNKGRRISLLFRDRAPEDAL
jgi:hypothetical protein